MDEEEYWETVTSSEESCDSDKIDSDIEAELYSAIHHEKAAERTSNNLSNAQSPQVTVSTPSNTTPNKSQHGSVNSDASKSFETHTNVKSNASVNDLYTEEIFDGLVGNLYTSFETPEVTVTKDIGNMNAKRKSDVSVEDLCTSLDSPEVKVIKDYSDNTNAKRKSDVSISEVGVISRKKQKLASRKSFVCDTSDSDSILWSDGDDCDIQLQTNVENEVVTLDSDSFSDESYEPFEEICSFRRNSENLSQPSTSNSSNDPWHINSDDLYRSKGRSKSNRYHERAVLKCTNCNLRGHTVKFCSVPKNVKCYVCGGSHSGMRCNHKVCSRCFQNGHDARFCRQRFVDLCLLCNMRGHSVKYCPDLWRRYHLTTDRGNIVIANPVPQDFPIYCFNCGEQGHYGAECTLLRPDRHNNFQTWTSVIAHVHPSDTIKRVMEDQRNAALGRVPDWPIYNYPIPPPPSFPRFPTPTTQKKKKKKKNSNTIDNIQLSRRGKKKKNKASSTSQTPPNTAKTTNSKEFNFPRTPKSERKNFKRKQKFETESFMTGLHRRLGLNPASGLPNKSFM